MDVPKPVPNVVPGIVVVPTTPVVLAPRVLPDKDCYAVIGPVIDDYMEILGVYYFMVGLD